MTLFLSTHINKVDKKGRVSVPAQFRAELAAETFQGVVLFRSNVHPALEGFAWSHMQEIANRLDNFDIYSIDGNVAVDFVGRYENLADDLKLALDHVGLNLDCELPRAKTNFRPTTLPYRDYYDEDTRAMVGRWYAREIELLDYEF